MADLTAEQAIEKLRSMPEDKQKDILGKLPSEMRKGILDKLRTPGTAGERYMLARRSGDLPKAEVSSFLKAPGQRLGEIAAEAGGLAQQYQTEASPETYSGGRQTGTRSFTEQAAKGLMSSLYETTGVGAKVAGAFTDPKTLAALVVSKLGPYGALAAAQYFGYQSAQGLAGAISTGKVTPDSLQNALLGLAGIFGAAGMGAEARSVKVPITPAEIKAKLQPVARRIAGPESALRKTVGQEAEAYQKAVPENAQKLQDTIKENETKLQSSRFREGEQKYKIAKTNKEIEAENLRKTQERETAVKARQEGMAKVEEQSRQAKDKIEKIETAVWEEANRKFDAVKTKIGADTPGEPQEPPAPLIEAVNVAENNILRGIPESIPLFRQILKIGGEDAGALGELREQVMQGQNMKGRYEDLDAGAKGLVDDIAKRYGGEVSPGQPITWSKLQRMKTAADTAIRSRGTQPIIKEALTGVRDTIVDMMGRMAESRGAGAEWNEARDFYSAWREDFHKRSGPAGSASPVAETLQAVDPRNIREKLMRTQNVTAGDNRAIQILRKYGQYGGTEAADLVQQMVDTQRGIGKEPGPVKLEEPKPVPGPRMPPRLKALPEKVPQPEVNATEVARKALEERARNWGSFNARDVGILASSVVIGPLIKFLFPAAELGEGASNLLPVAAMSYEAGKYYSARALRNPSLIKWLEKTPPEELRALSTIPGADKVKIVEGITQSAVQTLQDMDFSTDNTAMDRAKQELGPSAKISDVLKRAAQMNAEEIARRQGKFDAATGKQVPDSGKAVNLSPEVRQFLGPENVAKIMAAVGASKKDRTNPVTTPAIARQRLGQPQP